MNSIRQVNLRKLELSGLLTLGSDIGYDSKG